MPTDTRNSEFDPNDPRLAEAVELIKACSDDPELKARYRKAAEDSDVLAVLGVTSAAPDREKAIGDVAAVLAAFSYAQENKALRLNHVQETLEGVLKNTKDIQQKLGLSRPVVADEQCGRILMEDVAGHRARMMVEEEALRSVLDEALPSERPRNRFQFTDKQRVLSAIKSGGRVRQAIEGARRARSPRPTTPLRSTANLARQFGLPPAYEAIADRCAVETFNRLWGGIELLADTLQAVLATFPQPAAIYRDATDQAAEALAVSGRTAATHVIPSGMVLAWGALELFVAWAPDKTPTTTQAQKVEENGKGNLSNLLVELQSALETDDADQADAVDDIDEKGKEISKEKRPIRAAGEDPKDRDKGVRSQQRLVVAAWKRGRHAVLFDGRTKLTRGQRIERLRNKELDAYYGGDEGELPIGACMGC